MVKRLTKNSFDFGIPERIFGHHACSHKSRHVSTTRHIK